MKGKKCSRQGANGDEIERPTDTQASCEAFFYSFRSEQEYRRRIFRREAEKRENRRRDLCSRIRKGYAKPYYSRVIVSSPLRSNNNFEPLPWLGARTWRALTKMETDVEYPSQREKGQQQNFLSLVEFFLLPIRE